MDSHRRRVSALVAAILPSREDAQPALPFLSVVLFVRGLLFWKSRTIAEVFGVYSCYMREECERLSEGRLGLCLIGSIANPPRIRSNLEIW